jgi:hypothetical protein
MYAVMYVCVIVRYFGYGYILYGISARGIYCTIFRLGVYIVRYFGKGYILFDISARGIYFVG